MKENFIDTICTHIRAGTPCLVVNTDESVRVTDEIRRAAWKVGDGTKIRLSPGELNEFEKIAKEHAEDTYKKMIATDKQGPHIIYDSDALYKLLLAIERKLGKDDKEANKLDKQTGVIEDILNGVYPLVRWNEIDGFDHVAGKIGAGTPDEALPLLCQEPGAVSALPSHCIVIMRDCHAYFNTDSTPRYRTILRNIVEMNLLATKSYSRHIVFVQPDWIPHRDIQNCVSMVDFPLPTEEHLDKNITYIENSIDNPELRNCNEELRNDLTKIMRGFTETEAINALSYCVAKHGGFKPEMTKTIQRLQMAAFSKSGVLSMVDEDSIASVDQIGGFENYMEFIDECILCYSADAKKLKLAKPKGCLLLGSPGTGKSLVARATARKMKLPLLVYDFGAQFGSLIGQTESTQRQVLKQITAKGPCVVLLDEADKVFAGSVGGFQGDSGVSMRSFGRLLSWMSSENEEAFVIMTMNRTLGIPPEMLRAGRLDAIFYTTFPSPRERLDILGIHMKKNGADPGLIAEPQWTELVKQTDHYVGAELEALVKKAVRTAFKSRKALNPTYEELMEAKKIITPVVTLDKANIEAIEAFCKSTATPVSNEDAESKVFKNLLGRHIKLRPSNN